MSEQLGSRAGLASGTAVAPSLDDDVSATDDHRARPSASPAGRAVWLTAKHGELALGPAEYPRPGPTEIVVRNRAVAMNPVDWITVSVGGLFFPWLKYPLVPGSDVAGEVVEVGREVSRFKPGDRVLGHALGWEKQHNNPAEGAFRTYTLLLEHMASAIPDDMAFERAAVLPLALSTAASGLFQQDQLALQYPTAEARKAGKTVLVWGGSTSVGSNAIQLAVAAGYEVIATASPKNFAYVKALGAALVYDYRNPTVVEDIVAAFEGRSLAGALAIGIGSAPACLDIVDACTGDKFVAMVTPSVSFAGAPSGVRRAIWLGSTLVRMVTSTATLMIRARLRGIGVKFVWGGALAENDLSRIIYGEFLPRALAEGRYRAVPDPIVTGHGLEAIPTALETQRAGVSARKVVVTL